MIKEKFLAVKQELLSLSKQEKIFIFCAMVCSFFICAEYAIIRPVSNSVFISAYGTHFFPYAWLATVPLNFAIVSLYNRFLPRFGYMKMFLLISFFIVGSNVFCGFFLNQFNFLPFFFYIWKEIYILLMFQQLWSLIHSNTTAKRAKYLYGILFGIGGIGAICGSLIPSLLAVNIGSQALLFLSVPPYMILTFFFLIAFRNSAACVPQEKETESLFHGIKLISNSRFLLFILALVVFMQTAASLVDYQFNYMLEKAIPETDLRTAFFGKILALVQCFTVAMQFGGTFLILHFLGLKKTHLLVPCVLCMNAVGFMFFPLFGMMAVSYVTIKAFDFSIFGVIKEMLYLQTKPDEKFRAKAFIDVFAYRTSKALSSFLILGLQALFSAQLLSLLSWSSVVLFVLWGGLSFYVFHNASEEKKLYEV